MQRGIAYRRSVRNKHIRRKRKLALSVIGTEWYKHLGQYSKGKIHCSCRMCTYSKYHNLPTFKDYKEKEIVKSHLYDLYSC